MLAFHRLPVGSGFHATLVQICHELYEGGRTFIDCDLLNAQHLLMLQKVYEFWCGDVGVEPTDRESQFTIFYLGHHRRRGLDGNSRTAEVAFDYISQLYDAKINGGRKKANRELVGQHAVGVK